MCGRYYVDDETAREIEKLVRQVDEKLRRNRPGGDIYPGGEERFVILTRQANCSVADIHSRMPLILEQKEIEPWIGDGGLTEYFLQKDSCLLKRRA